MKLIKFNVFLKRIGIFPLLLLIITLLFSSCVSQRNIEYLRDPSNRQGEIKAFYEAKIPDYKLKPKDELFIQINSLDDPSTNVFQQSQQGMGMLGPYGASLMSYKVDKEGYSNSWEYSGGR